MIFKKTKGQSDLNYIYRNPTFFDSIMGFWGFGVGAGGLRREGDSGVKGPTQEDLGATEGAISREVGGIGKVFLQDMGLPSSSYDIPSCPPNFAFIYH